MDDEWRQPVRLLLCLAVFVVLAVFNLAVAVRQMPPTGDEPHYLITALSLANDQDLSLQNNYATRQYRAFYPGELAKRTTPSADRKRELPAEGLGLSFLLAPAYRLFSRILPATWLVPALRLLMCSITTIVLYFLLSLRAGRGMGLLSATFLCSPLLFYSGQFYPEIPAAVLMAVALSNFESIEEHPWNSLAALALIPGALIWIHPKFVVLAVAVLIVSAISYRRTFRVYRQFRYTLQAILLCIVGAAGIFTFFFFLHNEYGGWSPNRIYAGWEPQQQQTLFELLQQEGWGRSAIMLRMLFGFWIDQRFGLLMYAPFYIAFIPALIWMIRTRVPHALPITAMFGAHFLALCWGAPLGGFAPPSRHLIVLIPIFLYAILQAAQVWTRKQRTIFNALIAISLLLACGMAANYRALFSDLSWRNHDELSQFWQIVHAEQWLPQLTAVPPTYFLALIWSLAFVLLARVLIPTGGQEPSP